MEHTKGEISITDTNEHGDYYIGNKDSHSYIAIVVADVLSTEDIAEANAEELVRRWNAFEKDGLVDELRGACEKGHTRLLELGQRESMDTPKMLKAAIAKAKS